MENTTNVSELSRQNVNELPVLMWTRWAMLAQYQEEGWTWGTN